jgi:hypothetical protein
MVRGATVAGTVGLTGIVRYGTTHVAPGETGASLPIPGVATLAELFTGEQKYLHEFRIAAAAIVVFLALCAVSAWRTTNVRIALIAAMTAAFAGFGLLTVSKVAALEDTKRYPDGGASIAESGIAQADLIGYDTNTTSGWPGTPIWIDYLGCGARMRSFDANAEKPPQDVDLVISSPQWHGTSEGFTLTIIVAPDIAVWSHSER